MFHVFDMVKKYANLEIVLGFAYCFRQPETTCRIRWYLVCIK